MKLVLGITGVTSFQMPCILLKFVLFSYLHPFCNAQLQALINGHGKKRFTIYILSDKPAFFKVYL